MQIGWVLNLGTMEYRQALNLQQMLCFKRAYDEIPDTLLLLEHPNVYTLGRRSDPAHIFIDEDKAAELGADIVHADRGGSVTYHGPGQLVAYPILSLGENPDLHQYLRDLEEVLIQTLKSFNIDARRIPNLTGVWVEGSKIGFIGVKVTRGITKHGFSLNINPRMNFFDHIDACGLGKPTTSMQQLIDPLPDKKKIHETLIDSFAHVFQRKLVSTEADVLDSTGGGFFEFKVG